jgi:hypothetical protein
MVISARRMRASLVADKDFQLALTFSVPQHANHFQHLPRRSSISKDIASASSLDIIVSSLHYSPAAMRLISLWVGGKWWGERMDWVRTC